MGVASCRVDGVRLSVDAAIVAVLNAMRRTTFCPLIAVKERPLAHAMVECISVDRDDYSIASKSSVKNVKR